MNTTRKHIIIGEIFLLLVGIGFSSLAFADYRYNGARYNNYNDRYTITNADAGDESQDSEDDTGSYDNHVLSQSDEDNLNRRINGIPSFQRIESLLLVLTRIEALEVSIGNNSSMTSERKARLIAVLEAVKEFIQERLSDIVGTGSTSGTGTPSDTTPPVISDLRIIDITTARATLSVSTDENGAGYFVVASSGSTAPTTGQVRSGQGGMSGSIIASGSKNITQGTTRFDILNLAADTAYVAYFVAVDTHNNATATPMSVAFKTSTLADTTPPTIISLSSTGTTNSGTTLVANLSKSGMGYYIIVTSGAAMPTSVQIKAGQNAAGMTARIKGLGATQSGSTNLPITGLSPNYAYDIFFTAEDMNSNLQPIPQKIVVTTPF